MNISAAFIKRPVGTSLLTLALALAGAVAFRFLPVSPIPQVEFPTIQVQAALPGASPETMASAVAMPLERQFGRIAGVTDMTSTSYLGSTAIVLQFDLSRNIDGAARDVQAAINAARGQLPSNLPNNPNYQKVNPADAPILILALTSDTIDTARMYDAAASILQQKLSQIEGVGQVIVGGSSLPAVRVDLNPTALNNYGIGLDQVRAVLSSANANRPKGQLADATTAWEISATDQLQKAEQYRPLIVAYRNGAPVRLSDVGAGRRLGRGRALVGARERQAGDRRRHLPATRRQHHRDRRPRARAAAGAAGLDPAGHRYLRRHRSHADDPRLDRGRRADAAGLDRRWSSWWCSCSCATCGPPSFPASSCRSR